MGSWDFPAWIEVVAQPCEVRWELDIPSGYCVAPLWIKGLGGKQSTPSVGWEVPVSWWLSASRSSSGKERKHEVATSGYQSLVTGTQAHLFGKEIVELYMVSHDVYYCVKFWDHPIFGYSFLRDLTLVIL